MKANKLIWLAPAILLGVGTGTVAAATNEVSALLQQGLFEEEANQNLDAAIQAYQSVIAQTDKNRQFAATAIFRLGECYRKQGKTNEAAAQYQRILRDYADQPELAKLSRQYLAGFGVAASTASPAVNADAKLLAKLINRPQSELEKIIPTLVPDPVLTSLLQQRNEAETKLAAISSKEGEHNLDVITAKAVLDTINKQISEKIFGIMAALQLRAEISAPASAGLETQSAGNDEDKELARVQQMVQNSPDWINVSVAGGEPPLVTAAQADYLRVAQYLLDHNADVNIKSHGKTPLIEAATWGRKAMVEFLLSRGADVNASVGSGTALSVASRDGFQSVVEVLLAHHADVNAKSNGDTTPLHTAATKGFADIAGLLITNGADVNAADNNGYTPLYWAAFNGNVAVMELLIAHKAAVNSTANDGQTPLFAAVQQGRLAAAALLLKNGADVNAKQDGFQMPLHIAVKNGDKDLVKLLLDNGADANARLSWYNFTVGAVNYGEVADVTPLIMAVMNRQPDIVNLLVEHKTDVNSTDAAGDTALTVLAGIKLAGQDTRPPGSLGVMPIGMPYSSVQGPVATLKSQLAIADTLLAAGADVNAQNNSQQSALSLAVNNRSSELVKLLLQHKAKIDVADSAGWTPLQRAVSLQATDIAGSLLDAGANPNVKIPPEKGTTGGWIGYTPLGIAVASADKPMVQVLLSHKADPNLPDDSGSTPLSIAWQCQKDPRRDAEHQRTLAEITELLLKAGANENLHRLSIISVGRAGDDYMQTVFLKATNSFNRYTLFQLLTAFYAPPIKTSPNSPSVMPGLAFPDFGKISISRLQKDGKIKLIPVDLEKLLMAGDCSQDVPLDWGDVVEIPESDHIVGETWMGLADKERQTLWKCLGGKVAIVVKGQTNLVELTLRFFHPSERGLADANSYNIHYPAGFYEPHGIVYPNTPDIPKGPWSFWLYDVVDAANVILTSSDLSRVKVTRIDPATRKPISMVFDLQKENPANDLWLRDGDVIELPEKP